MANRGRSSDHPYPTGQYPPSRDQPGGQREPARPQPEQHDPWSEQREPWPEQPMPLSAPTGQYEPAAPPGSPRTTGSWPTRAADAAGRPGPDSQADTEMPPPEWADPVAGRRWTSSWRAIRSTAAQPTLPTGRTAPPRAAPPNTGQPPLGRPPQAMPPRETGGWPTQAAAPAPAAPEQLP